MDKRNYEILSGDTVGPLTLTGLELELKQNTNVNQSISS